MVMAFAALASLATTGCEDSVDWFLDVASAAGGAAPSAAPAGSPGASPSAALSPGSISSRTPDAAPGGVIHGDGSVLGTGGDQVTVLQPGAATAPGGSLLAHGPVLSSPGYQPGYQGMPTYQGLGPSIQVPLAPMAQAAQPRSTQPYPRMTSGPTWAQAPVQYGTPNITPQVTSYPSPPAFPGPMAAAPAAQPAAQPTMPLVPQVPATQLQPAAQPFPSGAGQPALNTFGANDRALGPADNTVALGGATRLGSGGLDTGGDFLDAGRMGIDSLGPSSFGNNGLDVANLS